jgi:hypothetical protein
MNEEQWVTCLNDLMGRQMNAAKRHGVIFTVALSSSQVRVFVEVHGQKCKQYFIYRKATDDVAKRVIIKIDNYLNSLSDLETWVRLNN